MLDSEGRLLTAHAAAAVSLERVAQQRSDVGCGTAVLTQEGQTATAAVEQRCSEGGYGG